MSIEAMKQALEALEHSHATEPMWKTPIKNAIASLRQAIAEAEKQEQGEPVAWMNNEGNTITWDKLYPDMTPLYTHPQPKAEPVAFVIKQYINECRPSIKGNGFDGLEIGYDREEAQAFVDWVNKHIHPQPKREPLTDEQIANLWADHCFVWKDINKTLINPIVFARAIEAAHGIKENT